MSVMAVSPQAWVVEIEGRPHVVAIAKGSGLTAIAEIRVDDQVTKLGGVRRSTDVSLSIGSARASLHFASHQAGFKRNFIRSLKTLGGNANLVWLTFHLELDGASDGSWVETRVGASHHHWSFGRSDSGLPCCGIDPAAHDVWCPTQLPNGLHDDPVLEAVLPPSVAGRPLLRSSYVGWHMLEIGRKLSEAERRETAAELAADGLQVDDVRQAFAGRATPADPPYSILAFTFRGRPASAIPTSVGLRSGGPAEGLAEIQLGGKAVRRGVLDMVFQDEHARGLPYLYDHEQFRFVVVSDDEAWAADAISQLP